AAKILRMILHLQQKAGSGKSTGDISRHRSRLFGLSPSLDCDHVRLASHRRFPLALVTDLTAHDHVCGNFLALAGRVVLAEAILEHIEQAEVLLANEAAMTVRSAQHEVDHGAYARGGRHLDRRPKP